MSQTPILGRNVLIQFLKNGSYLPFACAADVSIDFQTEIKSIKTVGDGYWDVFRAQKTSYTMTLNGLVLLDDPVNPMAFDLLLSFQITMAPVPFRLLFQDTDNNLLQLIEGQAIVVDTNLSGPPDGFAQASIQFQGVGNPNIRNSLSPCGAVITGLTIVQTTPSVPSQFTCTVAMSGTTVSRWDYSITSATGSPWAPNGISSAFTNPFTGPGIGLRSDTYNLTVTPICDNGYSGTAFTKQFIIGV